MAEASTGRLVCQERFGCTSRKYDYILKDDENRLKQIDTSVKHSSITHLFKNVFLPQGYPESVSPDYLRYQIWDTIQAFASSITGALAAHAVLKGVGVGDEEATVLGATISWLLKDGTGMVGRILFAWAKGNGLDCDAKRWRLFADVLNDTAIFMDILAPSFRGYFTLIVCTSGVCRSIVGVAGGATRAALTQHQARRNNMADVSAKDGSQETLVNLAALLCNLMLLPLVSGQQIVIWLLFFLFTLLHLFANYKAVRSVCMETLNQARLHYIVNNYLLKEQVLDVATVNKMEPVLFPVKRPLNLRLGVSVGEVTKSISFNSLMDVYERSMTGYILALDFSRKNINIVLSQSSDMLDQIQACFHAELLNFIIEQNKKGQELSPKLKHLGKLVAETQQTKVVDEEMMKSVLATSLHFVESWISPLTKDLHNKGWITEIALLGANEWRALWDYEELISKKSN
ncbi:RUS family member 1-like [Biomphalaria glabrata]|uniref:RUS family member 1-like n=1 Tax=Biomphalaria glabrata TaxID=6526 RepID=A0A9U8DXT4_BIOGL|nr:RUS family member 1-like [Biomphalaria glabrata]